MSVPSPFGEKQDLGIGIQRVLRPREQVEHQLREAIYGARFTPGQKLPSEAELAKLFAVSRPTVREALRSLSAAGLIRTVPGARGGSFVSSLDHESLGDALRESMRALLGLRALTLGELTQTRELLEVPSAQLAAELRSDEQIQAMKDIVEAQHDRGLSAERIAELDRSFHGTVADASGNRVLAAFVTSLHRVTNPVNLLVMSDEVKHDTVVQHHRILAAIERRDSEAAGAAMETHLRYLERVSTFPDAEATGDEVLDAVALNAAPDAAALNAAAASDDGKTATAD
jgi:GntR family transcriptional repressor for pyruvate dehydrogenase complex